MKITTYYDDIHIDKDTDWRDPLPVSSPSNHNHNKNSSNYGNPKCIKEKSKFRPVFVEYFSFKY